MKPPNLLPHLIVPQDVRYDGVQETTRGRLLCFTDLETHGSFSILEVEARSVLLARTTAQLRRSFRTGSMPQAGTSPTTAPGATRPGIPRKRTATVGGASPRQETRPLSPPMQHQPRQFAGPDHHNY